MEFKLEKNKYDLGETSISNIFFNDFMPLANGDFVKVYLLAYKLCLKGDKEKTNNKFLADMLGMLESDIVRAWNYWQKQGIVKISEEGDIEFVNLKELYIRDVYNLKSQEKTSKYSDIVQDPKIANLLAKAEFLMRENIPSVKKMDIASWIDVYNEPAEVIEEAFYYATEVQDVYDLKYIEKIVRNWSKDGIRTVEDVENSYINRDQKYYRFNKVRKFIGIERKKFNLVEFNIVNSWFDDMGFDMDMVTEACKRTANISKPNINYVNKILKSWKEKDIKSPEEIPVKDKIQKNKVKTKFHNFKQITDAYSEDELEEVARKKREESYKRLGI